MENRLTPATLKILAKAVEEMEMPSDVKTLALGLLGTFDDVLQRLAAMEGQAQPGLGVSTAQLGYMGPQYIEALRKRANALEVEAAERSLALKTEAARLRQLADDGEAVNANIGKKS